MRIKQNSNPKKILVALIILLLLGGAVVFLFNRYQNSPADKTSVGGGNSINYGPATDQQKKEGAAIKEKALNNSTTPKEPLQGSIQIASAFQEKPGAPVVVQTKLQGSGWQQCELALSQNGTIITKTANVLFQPSFSTCEGFSIPASEFSSAGEWTIKLTVTNTDTTALTAATKTITIVK